jgi:hypothetical protein
VNCRGVAHLFCYFATVLNFDYNLLRTKIKMFAIPVSICACTLIFTELFFGVFKHYIYCFCVPNFCSDPEYLVAPSSCTAIQRVNHVRLLSIINQTRLQVAAQDKPAYGGVTVARQLFSSFTI